MKVTRKRPTLVVAVQGRKPCVEGGGRGRTTGEGNSGGVGAGGWWGGSQSVEVVWQFSQLDCTELMMAGALVGVLSASR